MSNYILDNTASDINTALGKVLNLDTSPTDTDALITSGGVKAYVDTEISAIPVVASPNIVQSVKTTSQNMQGGGADSSPAWQDITDLAVSITSNYSNSKLLIRVDICFTSSSSQYAPIFRILVDGTVVGVGNSGVYGIPVPCSFFGSKKGGHAGMSYLYSGTLSAGQAASIKIQGAKSANRDVYVNEMGSISQVMVTEIYQ